jgi:hypothetical protein
MVGGRFRKTIWRYNRRKRALVYKKRILRRARKRGAWQNFTARRTNQEKRFLLYYFLLLFKVVRWINQ